MNYEKIIKYRNDSNAFANMVNSYITELDTGYAKAEMTITEKHLNPVGSVHGGCLYTIADIACGAAASSHGYQVTTLDSNFHYLRPGLGTTHLYAEARELKYGKRVMVYQVTIKDQNDTVLTEGIFTFMSLGKKLPIDED